MRIAHLSDLHFCPKHLTQVDACMAHAIDTARCAEAELAVITGDSTDHALDAHSPAFAALAKRLRQLADHCPVLLLQGTFSHEPPGLLRALQLVGARHPIHVADRLSQVAWVRDRGWVVSDRWRFDESLGDVENAACVFSCVPTINKADFAAVAGAERAAEQVGETLFSLLAGLGVINQGLRARGVPTVGLGHGTVAGCSTEHDVPMAGLDHEFGIGSLAASQVSAFMLGHIHKHQSWRVNDTTIAYAGSIARLHYGERGNKGMLVWDVSAAGAEFTFHATPARQTLEFEFHGLPDLDVLKQAAEQAQGAYVRVRYSVPEEDSASVDRVQIATALSGACEVKIEVRVIPVTRARAQGIGQATSMEERVARYAELAGIDQDGLCRRLRELGAGDPDFVARNVLRGCGTATQVVSAEGEPDRRIHARDDPRQLGLHSLGRVE